MPGNAPAWKTIAWNGLSLAVPPDWQLADLQSRSLSAAGQAGLRIELSWKHEADSTATGKALERAAARLGSGAAHKPSPGEILAAGEAQQQQGVEVSSLAWSTASGEQGALMSLAHTQNGLGGTAKLVFPAGIPPSWGAAARLLAGIRLHGTGGPVPWAVHGLEAEVPGGLSLSSFASHPGHFRLRLSSGQKRGGSELVLDRLEPAAELLDQTELPVFGDRLYANLGADSGFFAPEPGTEAASGRAELKPSLFARLTRAGAHRLQTGRVWRCGPQVILGAWMRGRDTEALDPFEGVCESMDCASG